MSSALFSPISLRGLELANRVVVSPMCQYSCRDGDMNDWHVMHLGQFAVAGAGLVFTEASAVSPEGRISQSCAMLSSDANEAAMTRVVAFCKAHGAAALGIQLATPGARPRPDRRRRAGARSRRAKGRGKPWRPRPCPTAMGTNRGPPRPPTWRRSRPPSPQRSSGPGASAST